MTLKADILTDLATFLDTDEFAEAFTFSRTGLSINCIFTDAFLLAAVDDQAAETSEPQILCKNSDITGVVHDDTFTRASDSTVYNVIGIEPEPTGDMTVIILSQQ